MKHSSKILNQQWEMDFKIPILNIKNSEDVKILVDEFHNVHFRVSLMLIKIPTHKFQRAIVTQKAPTAR